MSGHAYYNENDPFAAHMLREQIRSGVIAPGDVDERSIEEVTANDVKGCTQAHFFAGGGFWSIAARLAGWPDDKPLWTGSCPCTPFSVAGKRLGTDDPRHLWPDLFRIVRGANAAGFGPPYIVGEQVSGKAGYDWFDGVRSDLAQEGFSSRTRDIPACAVDAPHQRNRLFWVAIDDRRGARLEGQRGDGDRSEGRARSPGSVAAPDDFVFSDAARQRRGEGRSEPKIFGRRRTASERDALVQPDANGSGRDRRSEVAQREAEGRATIERANGSFWSDYEWIVSPLDGKARRAEPSIPFLVDGVPNRVGLWRVAGGAIVPQVAAEVLGALLDVERELRTAA